MINDTQEMKEKLAKERKERESKKNITQEEYERMMSDKDDD